jgi:hypothetical protein
MILKMSTILLLVLCVGCSDKPEITKSFDKNNNLVSETICKGDEETYKRFYKNGQVSFTSVEKGKEIISKKTFYETGELKSEFPYNYNGGMDDLVLQKTLGLRKTFYKNGSVKSLINYKDDDIPDGRALYFYNDEYIFIEEYYASFCAGARGILHGRMTVRAEKEGLISSGVYVLGVPWDGTFISGDPDIVIESKEAKYLLEYRNGKFVGNTELDKPVIRDWLHEFRNGKWFDIE